LTASGSFGAPGLPDSIRAAPDHRSEEAEVDGEGRAVRAQRTRLSATASSCREQGRAPGDRALRSCTGAPISLPDGKTRWIGSPLGRGPDASGTPLLCSRLGAQMVSFSAQDPLALR